MKQSDVMAPPTDAELEDFRRSHMMCAAISRATADFLEEICDGNLFGPPLCFPALEKLRQAVQASYRQYVAAPDPTPALPTHLKLVQ
jgi:hypothetical protein